MKHPATLLGLLILASACGVDPLHLPTSPAREVAPLPPLPPPSVQGEIVIGQEVTGEVNLSRPSAFELTAPSDGKLVVRARWDPGVRDWGANIEVEIGLRDDWFPARFSDDDDNGEVRGELTVVAGVKYRVAIAETSVWSGHSNFPISFITALER